MSLNPVGIDLQVNNAAQFTRDVNASEFALRQQAKAFDLAAEALKAEIAELKNADEPNKKLIQAKRELLDQTKASAAETRASIQAIKDQGSAYQESTAAVQRHKGVLATIGTALGSAAGATLKLIGTISTLVGAYDLLKRASGNSDLFAKLFDGVNAAATKAKGFIAGFSETFSGLGGGLKSLAGPAAVAAGSFGIITAAAIATGVAITAATAGITVVIGAFGRLAGAIPESITSAREFNAQLRTISTAMTGTADDTKRLGDNLLALSTRLNVPVAQLAASQYEILSAGISDTGLAFLTLDRSARLAKAGLSTVDEAANLVTSAINAFGIGPQEASDILFKTIQDGKTTAEGLSRSFGLVAGTAQSAGVTFKELNAATAALTLTGQTASTAQDNLRAAISNITQPGEQAQKVAKALGIEFNGAALQSKGLTGFLADLKEKVGDNKTALGQLFTSQEAYNAVVKLTGVSLGEYQRILKDLDNASGSLDDAFNKQRDLITEIANAIQNNLIRAGQAILTQFNPVLVKIADLFTKAKSAGQSFIDSVISLASEVARTVAGIARLALAFLGLSQGLDGATNAIKTIAIGLNLVNTVGEATVHIMAAIAEAAVKLASSDFSGAFNAVKNVPGYISQKYKQFKDKNGQIINGPDNSPISAAGSVIPKPNSDPSKSQAIATKNSQDSQNKADRQHVQDVQREFEHQLQQLRDRAELAIKQKGPFANEGDNLAAKLKEEKDAAGILNNELTALQHTQTKTTDGGRALKEATQKTKDELAKQKVAIQDAANALEKYNVEQKEADFSRDAAYQTQRIQTILDIQRKGFQEQAQVEEDQFNQGALSVNQYYDLRISRIKEQAQVEQQAYEATNQLIEDQIENIKNLEGITDESRSATLKDLRARQAELGLGNTSNQNDFTAQESEAERQRKLKLKEASQQFGQSLENDISQALQNAFSGQSPLEVIKSFGKSLYQTVVQALSNAVAQGFAQSQIFKNITSTVGDVLNRLSGKTKVSTATAPQGQGLAPLFPGIQTLFDEEGTPLPTPFQIANNKVGIATKTNTSSLTGLSTALGKTATVVGGLVAAFQGGKAIGGSALGSKFGAVGGAISGSLAGGLAGAAAGTLLLPGVGTLIGGAIGGIVGAVGGIFGAGSASKQKKQAARDAYHQNVLAPFLNNVVSNANPDNLDDLQASYLQAANGKKPNGSSGQALIRQAMDQILDLIAKRQAAIADFIKTTKVQNEDLADNIALNDAQPFQKAALERQIALKQIDRDTQDLLDKYKDSQQAQTEILEQESLKRQQLDQQEKAQFQTDTQNLADLLKQRDSVSNSNVYTRATSTEQDKANKISDLDQQISKAVLMIQGELAAGTTGDSLNSNQILDAVKSLTNQTNNLQVTINGATDPNAVSEVITRALQDFTSKIYGANA